MRESGAAAAGASIATQVTSRIAIPLAAPMPDRNTFLAWRLRSIPALLGTPAVLPDRPNPSAKLARDGQQTRGEGAAPPGAPRARACAAGGRAQAPSLLDRGRLRA